MTGLKEAGEGNPISATGSFSWFGSTPVKNHFSRLDPLRFGAALGVAIFHQMFWSWAWVSIGVPGFETYVAADVLYPSAAPFTWFG